MSQTLNICHGVDIAAHGGRDAILASSGGGKSYLMGVIIEETLAKAIPVAIFDIEGEHWPLAELYPMIIIGRNVPLVAECADLYAAMLLKSRWPLIFDFSELDEKTVPTLFATLATAIFELNKKLRTSCKLIIDEAHEFAAQSGGDSHALEICMKIAKRGRKFCIDSLWATQRPASINKNVISQCNRHWLGGIKVQTDYNAIRDKLDNAGISQQTIMQAKQGQFYLYDDKGRTTPLKAKLKRSRDGGAAIEGGLKDFKQMMNPNLSGAIAWLNDEIAKRETTVKEEKTEIEKLTTKIASLEKQLEQQKRRAETQRTLTPMVRQVRDELMAEMVRPSKGLDIVRY